MIRPVHRAIALASVLLAPITVFAQDTTSNNTAWQGNGQPQAPAPSTYTQPTYGPTGYAPAYGYNAYPTSYGQGGYQAGYTSAWRAPGAESQAPLVSNKDRLHYFELGMGAFVPTDTGNPAKMGLEANLWAIHGGFVPNSGLFLTVDASTGIDIGCMGKTASDGCKGHLRIHWIAMGPFFNTGRAMIRDDVTRSWDLMALTGAEVRVWKGMTVKTTVNWFLPNPWDVYTYQKQQTAQATAALAAAVSAAPSQSQGTIEAAAPSNPVNGAGSIYEHVLSHPQVNLMAMWEF